MSFEPDPRLLQAACRLAVDVAADGVVADPPVMPPAPVQTVLGFKRLSKAAYGRIRRAVDDDEGFRERVADAATEAAVGRAGWLWLHRPDGWTEDPAWTDAELPPEPGELSRLRRTVDRAQAATERHQQAALDAEDARRRAVERLDAARGQAAEVVAERDDLARRLAVVEAERNAAVRELKDVEATLAETRRDLNVAREATRQAESERLVLEQQLGATAVDAGPAASPAGPREVLPSAAPEPFDREGLRRAVDTASGAVAELGRALAQAAEALDPGEPAPVEASPAVAGPARPALDRAGRSRGRAGRRRSRRAVELPPGVFDGSDEAHRHVVADPGVQLLVDGYNLARAAWSGLDPQEERRRTVALLEEVQARSGGPVLVVFDGETAAVSPTASRSVRVRYSPTGTTADELIADILAELPPTQPVAVVSSDRAVAADARRQGATAITSPAFLAAARR